MAQYGGSPRLSRFPVRRLAHLRLQASDENFYGTTAFGGAGDYGTVFEITPNGKRLHAGL